MKEAEIIKYVAGQVCDMDYEDMTTAEVNIAELLERKGYLKFNEDENVYRRTEKAKWQQKSVAKP